MPQISALNVPKDVGHAVGVVSLSNIILFMICRDRCYWKRPSAKKSMFWAISKGEIVQHGFESLGLPNRWWPSNANSFGKIINYCLVLDRRV